MILNKIMLINFTSYKDICLIFLICTACTSTIKPIKDNESQNQTLNCPEGWDCSFELLKNKSAKIQYDQFNYPYLTIQDGKSMVLVFKYQRYKIEGTADSGYDEYIYLNIDNLQNNIELSNASLAEVDAIFGRMCFCTAESVGYFPIRNGHLKIKKMNKNRFKIDFSFKLKTVPQVIENINEILQY